MKTMTAKRIMDRRKASVCLFLILALLFALTALQVSAEGFDWELEEDLYRVLTYGELTVAPESVLPVYWVDTVAFAETGDFVPVQLVCSQDGGSIYIAKLLTKDGEFGGNLQYCVHDGAAHFFSLSVSAATESVPDANWNYDGSCDLADNAARFEALFGKLVSTETVQFVQMEGIGCGFYFPEERVLVYLAREGQEDASEGSAVSVDGEALLEDAKHYKAYREEQEQWAKEHPGEMLLGYTGGTDSGFHIPAYAWGILGCGSLAGIWLPVHSGWKKKKRIEEADGTL